MCETAPTERNPSAAAGGAVATVNRGSSSRRLSLPEAATTSAPRPRATRASIRSDRRSKMRSRRAVRLQGPGGGNGRWQPALNESFHHAREVHSQGHGDHVRARLWRAHSIAFSTVSVGPPCGPSTLPIRTFLTPARRDPPAIHFPAEDRARDVGAVTVEVGADPATPLVRGEVHQVLGVEFQTGKRRVAFVDSGIEDGNGDSAPVLRAVRRANGANPPRILCLLCRRAGNGRDELKGD